MSADRYVFKGNCSTVEDLPKVNNFVGDVYAVGPIQVGEDRLVYFIYIWGYSHTWVLRDIMDAPDDDFEDIEEDDDPITFIEDTEDDDNQQCKLMPNRTVKVTVRETRPRYTELSIPIPEYIPNDKINDYIMDILRIMKRENTFTFIDDPDSHPNIEAEIFIEDPELMSDYQKMIGSTQIRSGWHEIY